MKFKQLFELISENQLPDALTHEFLFRYKYAHIGSNETNVKAIVKYLKDNKIDRRWALVVEDQIDGETPYYFLLIAKVMNKTTLSALLKNIEKVISDGSKIRMNHYGLYPAEDLDSTNLHEYDPMGKYNVEDDVKDVWRKAVKNL